MSEKFSLSVNGTVHSVTADPDTPLLYVLRVAGAISTSRSLGTARSAIRFTR
jgi:aerobic-type carbon monoxide dehydrogenase small subunit (CoxS/CutS family)